MTNKRNIGTVAALGGLTAAVALITALPSARADELGDLRANQELLQRRIDQLAQVPPPGAPPGGPGGPGMAGRLPRAALGARAAVGRRAVRRRPAALGPVTQ